MFAWSNRMNNELIILKNHLIKLNFTLTIVKNGKAAVFYRAKAAMYDKCLGWSKIVENCRTSFMHVPLDNVF